MMSLYPFPRCPCHCPTIPLRPPEPSYSIWPLFFLLDISYVRYILRHEYVRTGHLTKHGTYDNDFLHHNFFPVFCSYFLKGVILMICLFHTWKTTSSNYSVSIDVITYNFYMNQWEKRLGNDRPMNALSLWILRDDWLHEIDVWPFNLISWQTYCQQMLTWNILSQNFIIALDIDSVTHHRLVPDMIPIIAQWVHIPVF